MKSRLSSSLSSSRWIAIAAGVISLVAVSRVGAQEPTTQPSTAPSAEELAKQLSNPIASLVSVPLQFNWENGVGPEDDLRFVLNFQPVVPFSLNENWNLIGRFILPYLSQPVLAPGGAPVAGTSDIVLSAFLSPSQSTRAVWGVGPVITLPTTTDPRLGSGKWSAGPTFVILKQKGPWTYGALWNQLWSYANTGDVDRADVNQMLLQPFLSHTSKTGLTVGVSSEATANWDAEETWTVPIFVNVSKVTRFGPFPFSMGLSIGGFAEAPDGGPSWKLRTVFTLILPKGK